MMKKIMKDCHLTFMVDILVTSGTQFSLLINDYRTITFMFVL